MRKFNYDKGFLSDTHTHTHTQHPLEYLRRIADWTKTSVKHSDCIIYDNRGAT